VTGAQGPRQPTWDKHCIHCGKPFRAVYAFKECCSATCQHKAWRARTMLAGTHGWRGDKWTRLKPSGS
jgi:hypothetical protein